MAKAKAKLEGDNGKRPNGTWVEYEPRDWGEHPDDTEFVTHARTTIPSTWTYTTEPEAIK